MKTSPFKVMTSAALATSLALPVAATTVDAAETEVKQIAFELDGEVTVVDYADYVDAIISESGELYEYTQEAEVTAIGVGDGVYVDYDVLVSAILDADADQTAKEVLGEQAENEDALVDEDTVAEYSDWSDSTEELSVTEVSASNLKQVEVTFSGDVSENDEASVADNYSLEDATVESVDVDGDTVTLQLEDAVANQTETELTVDSKVTGEAVELDVSFFDEAVPRVTGVEAVGNKTVQVSFTEPLDPSSSADVEDIFELNDGSSFVDEVEFTNNNTKALVTFYSSLDEGENTLKISNDVEDYAGYGLFGETVDFDVEIDDEAPELVSVENVTNTKATLVFNEVIDKDTVEAEDFYHTNSSINPSSVEADGNKVHLTFGEGDELPNGTAYLYVEAESIEDLWGNENSQQLSYTAEVEVDNEDPEVKSVEATAQNQLKVTFSEAVKETDEDNFTVLDSDGEELEDIVDNVEYAENDEGDDVLDTVIITLDENVYGEHTLVADGVEDLAGNNLDDDSLTFEAEDKTAPDSGDFTATLYNGNDTDAVDTLVVDFGEPMATDGEYAVTDLEKYVVGDQNLGDLDTVAITAFDKNSKVKIEVEEDEFNLSDGDNLDIARVADAAGNKMADLVEEDIEIEESDFVSYKSAEVTAHNELVLTLNDIVSNFDDEDFVITAGETNLRDADKLTGASIDNSGSTSVITFSFEDETFGNDGQYGDDYPVVSTVDADEVQTENQFGSKVVFGTASEDDDAAVTATDEIAPALAEDSEGDYMVDVQNISNEDKEFDLELTFTEDVEFTNDQAAESEFKVYDEDGNPLTISYDSDLEAGEYYVGTPVDSTVTISVYGNSAVTSKDADEYEVVLNGNKYFTDVTNGENSVEEFSVTKEVYDN